MNETELREFLHQQDGNLRLSLQACRGINNLSHETSSLGSLLCAKSRCFFSSSSLSISLVNSRNVPGSCSSAAWVHRTLHCSNFLPVTNPPVRKKRYSARVLSLPNMFTARARHSIRRFVLSELLFANWAGFGHHVGHNSYLSPRLNACPDTMHVPYQHLQEPLPILLLPGWVARQ